MDTFFFKEQSWYRVAHFLPALILYCIKKTMRQLIFN